MISILVIDDEVLVRKTLRMTLEAEGYRVVEADDGEVGVRKFVEEKPQAVLVDLVMPQKPGIDVIKEIRDAAPTAKIIAMSGGGRSSSTDLLAVARQLGADATIEKPFRIEDVVRIVKQVARG